MNFHNCFTKPFSTYAIAQLQPLYVHSLWIYIQDFLYLILLGMFFLFFVNRANLVSNFCPELGDSIPRLYMTVGYELISKLFLTDISATKFYQKVKNFINSLPQNFILNEYR